MQGTREGDNNNLFNLKFENDETKGKKSKPDTIY